jgi:hypothetical protein
MPFYYYLIVSLMILLGILFTRFLIGRQKDIPAELFAEALKNENSGHFEEAIQTYEDALTKVSKSRFRSGSLKNRIIEKLKVLHTAIEYQKSFHYDR